MIFQKDNYRCAMQGNIISHRGPHDLFEIGKTYTFDDVTFIVVKIGMSKYTEGVTNVSILREDK